MEATSRRVHTWCSVHVEQHSGEGVLALVLLWLGSRLDWASLNFSYLIFKLEHTAPVHQSCCVAGVLPLRFCLVFYKQPKLM